MRTTDLHPERIYSDSKTDLLRLFDTLFVVTSAPKEGGEYMKIKTHVRGGPKTR